MQEHLPANTTHLSNFILHAGCGSTKKEGLEELKIDSSPSFLIVGQLLNYDADE